MRALHAIGKNDPAQLIYEEDALVPPLTPGDGLLRERASGLEPRELARPMTWLTPDDTPRTPPIIPGHEVVQRGAA